MLTVADLSFLASDRKGREISCKLQKFQDNATAINCQCAGIVPFSATVVRTFVVSFRARRCCHNIVEPIKTEEIMSP